MQLVSGVLVFLLAVFTLAQKPYYDLNNASELFEQFIKDYNRQYKNRLDKEAHYNAFVASLVSINKYNQESSATTFDINDFADRTPEERQKSFGLLDYGPRRHNKPELFK